MISPSTNTMSQRLLMKRKAVCLEHPMQIDSGEIAIVRFSRGTETTIHGEMKYTCLFAIKREELNEIYIIRINFIEICVHEKLRNKIA